MKSRKARIFSIALALVVTLSLTVGCAAPTPAPAPTRTLAPTPALVATPAVAIPKAEIQEAIGKIDEGVSKALAVIEDIGKRTDTLLTAHPGDEKIVPFAGKMGKVEGTADALRESVEKLGKLAEDPAANEAALKETVVEVAQRSNELTVLVDEAHDLVHPVMFKYEKEGGEELHDLVHTGLAEIVKIQEDALEELATLVGATIPEAAIKLAYPEQYIQMYDEQGKLLLLAADKTATEAHGHVCVCGATAFRVTQIAISQLWSEGVPTKGELQVTHHHPGKGHKDVFEYLLGPENVTYEKAGDPKHLTLAEHYTYVFVRKDTGATWETVMKEGVIPEDFFDLRYKVKGFDKEWHEEQPTDAEKAAFKQKFNQAVSNILSMEASEVFEIGEVSEAVSEYQEDIENLTASAKELKKLINNMSAPAHGVPGDAGASIHTQFHRCEGFALAIYDSVEAFEELAADPEKNKEEMRELVVVELWDQLGSEMFGGLAKAISGMSEFIEQALAADAEDANALECQDILDEVADAQDTILEQVSELAAKVQDPIVWEYSCMGPLNPSRLANGNTLINEAFADRVIEVSPDGGIVWEYTGVVYPTDSERLENGNTLVADKGNKRIIVVTPDKEITWEYLGGGQELTALYGVRALDNGNVLIADQGNMMDPDSRARIIEVTPEKEIVWEYSGPAMEFICPSLGGRLANGNTLIADSAGLFEGLEAHVREVTPDKETVWEYSEGLTCVYIVHRLANGNTLICAQCDGRIIEVTPDGEIVWMYGAINTPTGMDRLENGNTLIGDYGGNRVIEVAAPSGARPPVTTEAKPEAVLTIVTGTETKALTLDEIKAMPSYTASGSIWVTHREVVKGPFEYTGVKLTDLLDLVGGISGENEVKVIASDEFAKEFTYDQIRGGLETFDREGNSIEWDQPIIVVLAYEKDGKPIEIPKGGPLRIAIIGSEEPITPGDCWVKWVEKVEIE